MPNLKKLTVYNSYKKEIVYNLVNFYRDIFMGIYLWVYIIGKDKYYKYI